MQRIDAHLLIEDTPSAIEEARTALQLYPNSKLLWKSYLKALAQAKEEKALLSQWRYFIDLFPEASGDREVMEWMAWCVIENGSLSSSPVVRIMAMLGAFFSQDAKGVAILKQSLSDENTFLRAAAVELSSLLPDAVLQDEVLRLFRTETAWNVRLEVIKAVGTLRIFTARKELLALIAKDHCNLDELSAAVTALVSMSDNVDRAQLLQLVQSNRAGLRLLACELIAYYNQKENVDVLLPLLDDYHPAVRAQTLQTLGKLRLATIGDRSVIAIAHQFVADPDPLVAITAAWLLTLHDQQQGLIAFAPLLSHQAREVCHLASAALASTGRYGLSLMQQVFNCHNDPYVKMNLALGLIGQRSQMTEACECLFQGLIQQKERWAWREEGGFRILAPSKLKHDDAIPNYPEAVNQLTHLEILEVLSVVHYPHAQEAIKAFLQESNWGISGLASVLLLTEGDDDAVELVKSLINDSNKKIRIKAALILAMWGRGEDAVRTLQEAYPTADRELKGQILEGIGRVGVSSSLPFLVEKLQEPYQTLRIIAAASLLECLYH